MSTSGNGTVIRATAADDVYYDVLNIPRGSSPEAVRKAYKVLVRKWHPDKHPPSSKTLAEAAFKTISQAYQALRSGQEGVGMFAGGGGTAWARGPNAASKRWETPGPRPRQYRDADDEPTHQVPRSVSARRPAPAAAGGTTTTTGYAGTTTSVPFTGLKSNPTFNRKMKPPPIERRLECTLEELFRGCKKEVRFTRNVIAKGGMIVNKEEVEVVRVRPGWKKGTKITFEEKGNEAPGSIPTDVIFVVQEKDHPYFKRVGNDLLLKVEIPLVDALAGGGWTFSFRRITGDRASLTLEPDEIVRHDHEKVLHGEGMPIAHQKGVRGDLRIRFKVAFPNQLSEDQKAELREIFWNCSWC